MFLIALDYVRLKAETMVFNDGGNEEKIADLQDRALDLNEQAQAIQNLADKEGRDLTAEEKQNLDTILASFEDVKLNLERRIRIEKHANFLRKPAGRQAEPQKPEPQNSSDDNSQQSHVRQPKPANIQFADQPRGRWGWRNLGEFAFAVKQASARGGQVDQRLIQNAPTTYGSEGAGADGGFAVPPDFREAIMVKVMAETSLLSRTDQMTSSSNSLTLPKDESTPWDSTGGIQATWTGEGKQLSQSKPALLEQTVKLEKLTVLVPMTEELLEDAPAMDTYLRRKVPEKMDFKITDAILNGDGVAKPAGILASTGLVTITKESGQAADTIKYENITKMWSRMYGPSRPNGVWLVNQDIEQQLFTMSFEGTSSSVPAYLPANGLSASPFGTLMGRPVIPCQACQTLGDKGDIVFADLSQYLTVLKTAGIRSDVSIHLWFDYDTVAFRFIIRVAGKPWFDSPISPAHGSNTLSPFVTLEART